jgi:hypothetical protein
MSRARSRTRRWPFGVLPTVAAILLLVELGLLLAQTIT